MATTKNELVKEFIAKGETETGNNYNRLVGGKDTPMEAPVTKMTIAEVMAMQSGMAKRGHNSSALGKYQITLETLQDLQRRNPKEFADDVLFDEAMQERSADILIIWNKRETVPKLMGDNPGMTEREAEAIGLARRWASIPDPRTGKSFYDGDGVNHSSHSVDQLYKVIDTVEARSGKRGLKPTPLAGESDQRPSPIQSDSSGEAVRQDPLRSGDPHPSSLRR
jgi:hypothetical protein